MDEKSKSFRDLIVWKKAHNVVLEVYKLTKTFPKEELFCITSQIRRSTISIAANIAEGFKKKTVLEKIRFYNIAEGSLEETKYYLILIKDLGYANPDNLYILLEEVSKLLNSYKKSTQRNFSI